MDTQTTSQAELEARFKAMAAQRNNALDECVFLAGQRDVLLAQVAELQVKVKELTPPAEGPAS